MSVEHIKIATLAVMMPNEAVYLVRRLMSLKSNLKHPAHYNMVTHAWLHHMHEHNDVHVSCMQNVRILINSEHACITMQGMSRQCKCHIHVF